MTEILYKFFNHSTCPLRSASTILFNFITSLQCNILIEIVKGRKYLVALVIDNRIILKMA